jgi:hypothetical protein
MYLEQAADFLLFIRASLLPILNKVDLEVTIATEITSDKEHGRAWPNRD